MTLFTVRLSGWYNEQGMTTDEPFTAQICSRWYSTSHVLQMTPEKDTLFQDFVVLIKSTNVSALYSPARNSGIRVHVRFLRSNRMFHVTTQNQQVRNRFWNAVGLSPTKMQSERLFALPYPLLNTQLPVIRKKKLLGYHNKRSWHVKWGRYTTSSMRRLSFFSLNVSWRKPPLCPVHPDRALMWLKTDRAARKKTVYKDQV